MRVARMQRAHSILTLSANDCWLSVGFCNWYCSMLYPDGNVTHERWGMENSENGGSASESASTEISQKFVSSTTDAEFSIFANMAIVYALSIAMLGRAEAMMGAPRCCSGRSCLYRWHM